MCLDLKPNNLRIHSGHDPFHQHNLKTLLSVEKKKYRSRHWHSKWRPTLHQYQSLLYCNSWKVLARPAFPWLCKLSTTELPCHPVISPTTFHLNSIYPSSILFLIFLQLGCTTCTFLCVSRQVIHIGCQVW